MPIAAANMRAVADQPKTFAAGPLTLSPIILRLFETNMTSTSSGGEIKPLITAVQNSATMGLMPRKFIDNPTRVESAINGKAIKQLFDAIDGGTA